MEYMNVMNTQGMGWMMGGMWAGGMLLLIFLLLAIAALAMYRFFSGHRKL
jgi:hypothetical protein